MRFLVDAQLSPALAQWLREAGYEAQAVRDAGLRDADDSEIWRQAHANGQVIITKDEDFAQRAQTGAAGPAIVWLRIGNTSNAALRRWLLPQIAQVVTLLDQNVRVVGKLLIGDVPDVTSHAVLSPFALISALPRLRPPPGS